MLSWFFSDGSQSPSSPAVMLSLGGDPEKKEGENKALNWAIQAKVHPNEII